MAGEQRRDERQQRRAGRSRGRRPCRRRRARRSPTRRRAARARGPCARGAAPATPRERPGQHAGDRGRVVGARVVGDDDPPRERELGVEEAVQAADAALEPGLLVVDRDDDVDLHGWQEPRAVARRRAGAGGGWERPWPTPRPRRGEPLWAPWELAERRAGTGAAGSVTTNAAPPPSALAADTRPPCAATIAGHDREAEARRRSCRARGRPRRARSARTARRGRRSAGRGRGRAPRGARPRPRRATLTSIGVPAGRVHERVAQQVGEHLAQLVGVADDDGRPVVRRRSIARSGAVARASSTASSASAAEVDLAVRRVGHLVEPRERQQVLDEHAHARRLVLDPAHRLLDLLAARAPRPSGTARRSRGSRPAACAARARRRR